MSRWGTLFTRLSPGRGEQPGSTSGEFDPPVLVDEYDGLTLLRPTEQAVPGPADVAELARALGAEAGRTVATVVVGVDGPVPPALWTRLGDVLDALLESGTTTVRLVISGAGGGDADRPALAQRIADVWGLSVIAPEGTALLVPGGSLFVPDPPEPTGGWRLFQPGTESTPLGARHPAPAWQSAFAALPVRTTGGFAVRPIPAGVLLQPPGTRPPAPGALCYAVPVDAGRPTVLVGVPGPGGGARIGADDLAAVFAALPSAARSLVRVAPGAVGDLLPTAQQVTDALDIEVEVLTGSPLAVPSAVPSEGGAVPGAVLVDDAGRPTWRPYVEAVVCRPGSSGGDGEGEDVGPRLLRWRSPVPDGEQRDAGVVRLSERWQVTVTRAGLALGAVGQHMPLAGRPVLADQLAVEIGPSDEPLDESGWTALSHVLDYLDAEAREHAVVYTPERSAEECRALRRLTVQHGVRMMWPQTAGADPEALPEPVGERPPAPPDPEAPAPDGFSLYRERITGIVQAANAGRYEDATVLATALEREAFVAHGAEHPTSLQIRQIRAHVMRLAGHNALAADLYRRVAFSLLVTAGLDSIDAEQAAANADACWRDIGDIALALRIAPSVIALRQKVPGPDGRWLRAAERYRAQLDVAHAIPLTANRSSVVGTAAGAPTVPGSPTVPASASAATEVGATRAAGLTEPGAAAELGAARVPAPTEAGATPAPAATEPGSARASAAARSGPASGADGGEVRPNLVRATSQVGASVGGEVESRSLSGVGMAESGSGLVAAVSRPGALSVGGVVESRLPSGVGVAESGSGSAAAAPESGALSVGGVAESRSSSAGAAAESRSGSVAAVSPPQSPYPAAVVECRPSSAVAATGSRPVPVAAASQSRPPSAPEPWLPSAVTATAPQVRRPVAERELVPAAASRSSKSTGVLSPEPPSVGRVAEAGASTSCSAVAGRP